MHTRVDRTQAKVANKECWCLPNSAAWCKQVQPSSSLVKTVTASGSERLLHKIEVIKEIRTNITLKVYVLFKICVTNFTWSSFFRIYHKSTKDGKVIHWYLSFFVRSFVTSARRLRLCSIEFSKSTTVLSRVCLQVNPRPCNVFMVSLEHDKSRHNKSRHKNCLLYSNENKRFLHLYWYHHFNYFMISSIVILLTRENISF